MVSGAIINIIISGSIGGSESSGSAEMPVVAVAAVVAVQ